MPGIGKLVVGYGSARRRPSAWRWRLGLAASLALFFAGGWISAGSWKMAAGQTLGLALILVAIYLTLATPPRDRHLKP
jgi:hypothetical protein